LTYYAGLARQQTYCSANNKWGYYKGNQKRSEPGRIDPNADFMLQGNALHHQFAIL
jgi:hypothetical protein